MPTRPSARHTGSYQQQEIVDLNEREVALIKKKIGTGTNVDDITDMSLTLGDMTVQYDTVHGLQIEATGKISYKDGKEDQPIVDVEIPLVAGQGVTIDKDEKTEKVVIKFDAEGADTQFKTLFGNQHIIGKGNIDLYEHDVEITGTNSILGTGNIDIYKHVINFTDADGDAFFNMVVYSSNSLVVDSLTDLQTLIGDAATKNVSGFVYDGASSLYYPVFKVDTEMLEVYYVHPQNGLGSVILSDYTITDTVTTI